MDRRGRPFRLALVAAGLAAWGSPLVPSGAAAGQASGPRVAAAAAPVVRAVPRAMRLQGAGDVRDAARMAARWRVAVLVGRDVPFTEVAGVVDVLGRASRLATAGGPPWFLVELVPLDAETSSWLAVEGAPVPVTGWDELPPPDVLVVPGGLGASLAPPARQARLRALARETERLVSLGRGAFALADAGLLAADAVTTSAPAVEALQARLPDATVHAGRRFVDAGTLITGAGGLSSYDVALHMVARRLGRFVAVRVAMDLEYNWFPDRLWNGRYERLNPQLDERGRRHQEADRLLRRAAWAPAAEAYRALTDDGPDDGAAWRGLGVALRESGAWDEAAAALGRAAELMPREAGVHVDLARAHLRAGRADGASEALAAARRLGWDPAALARGDELEAIAGGRGGPAAPSSSDPGASEPGTADGGE